MKNDNKIPKITTPTTNSLLVTDRNEAQRITAYEDNTRDSTNMGMKGFICQCPQNAYCFGKT